MIDQLITALSKEVEMSAEEIADTIWLALQLYEFQTESVSSDIKKEERIFSKSPLNTTQLEEIPNQQPKEQKAGIYLPSEQKNSKSLGLSFKVPDAPSLREPLTLARALKPLMRRVPSGRELVLDEAATIQRIADEGLWIPVLKPTVEPWLDLELVVDEAISMQIWRHTIKELERLLKNYGIFRDVRVWGLITDENEQVQIRRGISTAAKNQTLRSPKELIDPSGRRLVLVVSDCVSSLWRNGAVTPVLELWAKQGSMAIVQMLPKWLWKRTALGRASEVRLQGLTPGACNQKLIAKEASLWDELEEEMGVKVPVFTLEQDKVATWAQMLAGKGSIWTLGYVFKLNATPVDKESSLFNLTYSDLSAEQRVQAFRVTASPMARKLAGLLASAPVISLPIVRLIRETLLDTSQQVHVAEVFLSGLLKPLSEINVDTNPDYVQYDFMDGVRELLVNSVPSKYVLDVVDEVSKYLAKKLGISLENFAAILKNPQQVKNSEIIAEIGYFATVTSQALRRLGGEYLKLADSLESNIPINKIKSEFEEKAYLLGQQGNTKIYSFCSDKPWLLPFDVFVIPMGLEFGFGSLALSFKEWLGKNFIFLIQAIEQEKNNKNQFKLSPKQPLLVALPSKINNQLFLFNNNQSQSFIICATAESPKPTIVNTGKVVESVINIAENQELKRIVIPLLGTGINNLPIDAVSHTMLLALAKSLKNSSSHQITEIIFVDKEESIINTINKVAKNIFSKKSLNEFNVPTSAKAKKRSSFNKINDGITKAHADKIIRILGPRGAGKTTFMSALASWSNAKSDNPILSVSSFGGDSANLINVAKDILEQGWSSVPTSRNEDVDNLPIYRLLIELKSTFLITKNVRLKISYRDYSGDIFQDLRGGASSFDLTTYLDDYANSSGLLLLLDSSSIEDRQYSQALARLQTELADRLLYRDISLRSYRIAIVFNKAELNQVWIHRHQIDKFVNLKFPKTKATVQEWSKSWGCAINYFFCSAFGMKGNPPQPNFKKQFRDDGGTYGVIANPSVWRPFGLVAPIYWLSTGKDDMRLRD
ncbi:MAG: SAV_2336 N-terminal domain-related protein [Nodularia sp. CChRGM 3473]